MFGLYGKDHPTYGRKHTDEWIAWSTKKLLALADKHWMKTPEKRKWLSENNPMHKPEIVALFMGKNNPTFGGHTAETILKMSGENHPNWKGGISHEPYCKEWDFDEFKKLIRDRDNNQCQNPDCWKTFNPKYKLSVHHINGDKKNCDPWNLISLCNSCNVRAEGNKKISRLWWQKLYQNIMAEKYGYKYD